MEYILCAAIWVKDGKKRLRQPVDTGIVLCGYRHDHCIATIAYLINDSWREDHTQGFLTSKGRFVNRVEALNIALKAGQTDSTKSELYSEDLY